MGADEGSPAPVWARPVEGGWLLDVRVQPGARTSEVAGPYGDQLRVRVRGRAVDGQANAELVRYLARVLGVPPRTVGIVRGDRNRSKTVAVDVPLEPGDLHRLTG